MKKIKADNKIFINALKNEPALSFVYKLTKKFPRAEIYLVGGAVRDIILGRKTKDFDFVVRHLAVKKIEDFLSKLGKVNLVGKSFGVLKFVPRGSKIEAIDIALPRTEHSLSFRGGYRDFKVQSDSRLPIKKDLERRDFTINALAFEIKKGRLIDHFNGLSDLAAEKIKAVGSPEKRFKEDHTRLLRGLRLSAILNFKIEEKTWSALKKLVPRLSGPALAREVMAREILDSFKANPVRAFDLFDRSGVFKTLMPEIENLKKIPQPEIYHSEGDVFVHTRLALEKIDSPPFLKILPPVKKDLETILAVFFHDIGKGPTFTISKKGREKHISFKGHDAVGEKITAEIIKRLKLESTGEIKKENVVWLVKRHMLLVVDDPYKLRAGTVEKIFFNPRVPGKKLLSLILADTLASLPKSGQPNTKGVRKMAKRVDEMKKMDKQRKSLPPPLISGHDIIKELKIKSGPAVGEMLSLAREKQLNSEIRTKKEALKFIKKYFYGKRNKSRRKRQG